MGRGMAQLPAVLDLPRFVLAGGVAAAGELLRLPAQVALESTLLARSHRPVPEVHMAELGPRAGPLGAADLARTAIVSSDRVICHD
jgi:glucokinase